MKHTYHILGQFSGYWIGLVPEVPGAITFARNPQALVKMLDDAVAAIGAAEKKEPSKAEHYVAEQWTDFQGQVTHTHVKVTPEQTGYCHPVEEKHDAEQQEKESMKCPACTHTLTTSPKLAQGVWECIGCRTRWFIVKTSEQ